MAALPTGFREDPDTLELRCPHRDLSTCDPCADAHDEIVESYGTHFWLATDAEKDEWFATLDAVAEDAP